jgi:hypothetical protein
MISTLIGIAISEGKIKSIEYITDYLTEFKNKPGFDKITINTSPYFRNKIFRSRI